MNDSRDMPRPPMNIARRPVNRPTNTSPTLNDHHNSESFKERRRLLLYVGDMVQVIDSKSPLVGKFGLVEEIQPRNKDYQVIVKIGKISNPLKFFQIKFCTRIGKSGNGTSVVESNKPTSSEEWGPGQSSAGKVSDYVDEIDEDNIGNREGANEKHGIKL